VSAAHSLRRPGVQDGAVGFLFGELQWKDLFLNKVIHA
jgi:hypothetical protein